MIWTRVLAVKNGSDEKLSDSAFIVKVKSIVFADKLHVVTKKERERSYAKIFGLRHWAVGVAALMVIRKAGNERVLGQEEGQKFGFEQVGNTSRV